MIERFRWVKFSDVAEAEPVFELTEGGAILLTVFNRGASRIVEFHPDILGRSFSIDELKQVLQDLDRRVAVDATPSASAALDSD